MTIYINTFVLASSASCYHIYNKIEMQENSSGGRKKSALKNNVLKFLIRCKIMKSKHQRLIEVYHFSIDISRTLQISPAAAWYRVLLLRRILPFRFKSPER